MLDSFASGRAKVVVLGGVALLVVLVLGAFLLLPRFVDQKALGDRVLAQLSDKLGATVECQRFRLALFPTPGAVLDRVTLSIPKHMNAEIQSLLARPQLLPLLRGKLRIAEIQLHAPSVQIQRSEQPATSGSAAVPSDPTGALESIMSPLLETLQTLATSPLAGTTLRVSEGKVTLSVENAPPLRWERINARLNLPPSRLGITLQATSNLWRQISVELSLDPTTAEGNGNIEVSGLQPHLVTKQLSTDGLRLQDSEMDLDIRIGLHGTETLSADVDGSIPTLTLQRKGTQAVFRNADFSFKVKLDGQEARVVLDRLRFDAPRLQLSGQLSVTTDHADLDLNGTDLDVESIRQVATLLAGDVTLVRTLFNVLRSGTVPEITLQSRAASLGDLGQYDAFTIRGHLNDGLVHIPGVELDLTKVSGDANVSSGVLAGNGVSAQLENSQATNGQFRLGLTGKTRELYVETTVQADAAETAALLRRLVHSDSFQREFKRVSDVSGTLTGKLLLDGTTKNVTVAAEASEFDLSGRLEGIPVPMQLTGGSFTYDASGIETRKVNVKAGASNLENLAVKIHQRNGTTSLKATADQSRILLEEVHPWVAAAGWLPPSKWIPKSLKGTVSLTSMETAGPLAGPGDWRVELHGAAQNFQVETPLLPMRMARDYPVSLSDFHLEYDASKGTSFASTVAAPGDVAGEFDLTWGSERLDVRHMRIHDRQSDASVALLLTPSKFDLTFKGSLHKATLDEMRANDTLGGSVNGDLQVRIRRDDPILSEIEGSLNGNDVTLPFPGEAPLNMRRFTLTAEDGVLDIDASLGLGPDSFELTGKAHRSKEGYMAIADLDAGHVDWGTIQSLLDLNGDGEKPKEPEAPPGQWPIQATIRFAADSFTYDTLTWDQVRGEAELANHGVSVKVTEADLCGIGTPGTISSDQQGLDVSFQMKAKKRSLEDFTRCFGRQQDISTGRYDLVGSFAAQGKGSELTRSVRGRIEYDATNGRVYGMYLMARLMSFLGAATGNMRNLANMAKEGLAYDRITIHGNVENSILQLEEATLEGPSVAWAADGSIDLVSHTLDLTFLVSALKNADPIVARIPIIGTIFGGSLVTYPVRVTGTVEEPSMDAASASAVGEGLLRAMKRTVELPVVLTHPFKTREDKQ